VAISHRLWPSEFAYVADEPATWLVPVLTMATFGWLLGTDRRWWPWILAPTAVLLSGGMITALMSSIERVNDLSAFGAAIPYAVIGLIFSFAGPLARRVSRRVGPVVDAPAPAGSAPPEASPALAERPIPRAPRWIRPLVALNAGALSLLLIAGSAFLLDPAPAQYGASLPTYLGERAYVQDLRTKLNLQEALGAAGGYRAVHGTYAGFTAAAGEAAVRSLAWADGIPGEARSDQPLRVGIVVASASGVRLVSLSESGRAFCARATVTDGVPGSPTYGAGRGMDGPGDMPGSADGFAQATAACGSAPLNEDALRPFPIAGLCDGVGDGSLVICRAVQRLLRQAIRTEALSGS
jgi:hypothetical protein